MWGIPNLFKRNRAKKLHFALVIADRPTDGFKFESDKDCKMFIVTGETVAGNVIPRTVLRGVVDKFETAPAPLEGEVKISEKTQ